MKKLFLFFFPILLVIACAKTETISSPVPDGSPVTISIIASLPDFTGDDVKGFAANYAGPRWEEGDELSIINLTTGKILKDHLQAASSGQKVKFSGSLTSGLTSGDRIAFLYPAQNNTVDEEFTSCNVDFSQQQKDSTFAKLCAYEVMTVTNSLIGEDVCCEIGFTMLMTFYQFSLSNLPVSTQLDRIELENVSNSISITINDGKNNLVSTPNESSNKITLTNPGTTKSNGSYTLRMSVVPTEAVASRNLVVYAGDKTYRSPVNPGAMESHHYYCEGVTGFNKAGFADPVVKQYCLDNYDYDGDGEVSYAELASVKSILTKKASPAGAATKAAGTPLPDNITSFNELQFFTGLTAYPSFEGYSSLTSVSVPEQITEIPDNCFSGCSALSEVVLLPQNPPSMGENVFDAGSEVTVYVPEESVETYQEDTNWSEQVEIKDIAILTPICVMSGESIQDAVNRAKNGSEIRVQGGAVFSGGIKFSNAVKDITISGGWNGVFTERSTMKKSVIDGKNMSYGFWCAGDDSDNPLDGYIDISGFEIKNCTGDHGSAVHVCGGPVTVHHCHIHDNECNKGAIGTKEEDYSEITVNNCIISDNYADGHGAAFGFGDGRSYDEQVKAEIVNNLIINNTSTKNYGYCSVFLCFSYVDLIFVNNTVVGNKNFEENFNYQDPEYPGIDLREKVRALFANNIMVGNLTSKNEVVSYYPMQKFLRFGNGCGTFTHNVYEGTLDWADNAFIYENNFLYAGADIESVLVNPSLGDYSPTGCAVGCGTLSVVSYRETEDVISSTCDIRVLLEKFNTDLAGHPRITAGTVCAGCFEGSWEDPQEEDY